MNVASGKSPSSGVLEVITYLVAVPRVPPSQTIAR
jgi:hypothetical protein